MLIVVEIVVNEEVVVAPLVGLEHFQGEGYKLAVGPEVVEQLCVSLALGMYGAQNEAYMSRSAEKWVRDLCFNELGVCG